jgi:hypothetical protein
VAVGTVDRAAVEKSADADRLQDPDAQSQSRFCGLPLTNISGAD